jgi:DNA-binding response OmpR family regulator
MVHSRQKSSLAHIRVLIADSDRRIGELVRNVLESLGFGSARLARDGAHALLTLQSKPIDLLITDWEISPIDGINLIRHIRSLAPPLRFLPIIMLTGNTDLREVEMARDAGVTEFLAKPFSARTLCDRIVSLIENPRSFILTEDFCGPDRRRRDRPPAHGLEKRQGMEEDHD